MIMGLKQRKIKFKPKIKLNHNIYTSRKLPLTSMVRTYEILVPGTDVLNGLSPGASCRDINGPIYTRNGSSVLDELAY